MAVVRLGKAGECWEEAEEGPSTCQSMERSISGTLSTPVQLRPVVQGSVNSHVGLSNGSQCCEGVYSWDVSRFFVLRDAYGTLRAVLWLVCAFYFGARLASDKLIFSLLCCSPLLIV